MKKSMVFEGIVTVLLIILLFAMYLMVTGSSGRTTNWEVKVGGRVWEATRGDYGTPYAFTGLMKAPSTFTVLFIL